MADRQNACVVDGTAALLAVGVVGGVVTVLPVHAVRRTGQELKLAEFMKEDFKAIYDNPAGTRRAIFSRGRKNAKTTECAMIVLLHLCGPEAKYNSSMYSCAQSRDQAAVLFALAAKMIRMSPNLRDSVIVKDGVKELVTPELGTKFKALSAEVSTAYGLSPVLTIFDELGQLLFDLGGIDGLECADQFLKRIITLAAAIEDAMGC
jgi:phage terminase large subunit-like protein